MGSWIVWLILAAVLGVAEVLTTTLAFGLIAVAALVAAVVGAFRPRPALPARRVRRRGRSRAGRGPADRDASHQAAAAAAHGDLGAGRAARPRSSRRSPRTAAGSASAARSGRRAPYDESQVIPVGSTVDVLQIEGATALVHPRE